MQITGNRPQVDNTAVRPNSIQAPVLPESNRPVADSRPGSETHNYLNDAQQDVQSLKNTDPRTQEPFFFKLSWNTMIDNQVFNITAGAMELADQSTLDLGRPMGPPTVEKSRLMSVNIESKELAGIAPHLTDRPFVVDICEGVDARLAVRLAVDKLVSDADRNRNNAGYQPPTGVKFDRDQEGKFETSLVGGSAGKPAGAADPGKTPPLGNK